MQLYSRVIKEVEQAPEGAQIGAFFDFDGTIIYGYSATKFLREQIRRGDIRLTQLPELFSIMAKFSLGNMDYSAMMTETSAVMEGIPEQEYVNFGEELYTKHIAKLIYPETRALIEAHLKKGHTVGLVSAATPYQVVPAAHDLGIPHIMCTHLEVSGGVFTGKIMHPTCYGMGKVVAAQKIIDAEGVEPEQSFFYTDSDEDLQLLEYVGKPRPLNPNSKLRSIARGRGWPVQEFNSRGSSTVKDYARTLAMQGAMVGSVIAAAPIYALTGSLRKSRNFAISLFADAASAIAGLELDVTGEEYVWSNRPCVFVFNHQSQADVLILASLLRRDLAGVGKKEISNVPVVGKIFEMAGTILIDRENTNSAVEAMQPLVNAMKNEGRSVCIAPEGTRSTSTNLGRFKKGPFHLALQAGVPMVPIVIHNAIDVSPRGEFVMRPATVKVTVLPPVDTSEWSAETVSQHVDYVRDLFLVELDQMELQQTEFLPSANPGVTSQHLKENRMKRAQEKLVGRRGASNLTSTGLQARRRKAKKPTKVSALASTRTATGDAAKSIVKKKLGRKKSTSRKTKISTRKKLSTR